MTPLLAIVGDTWRQSRQQVVFIIMLVLMLLVAAAGIVLPKSFPASENETERGFGTIFSDEPTSSFYEMWNQTFLAVEMQNEGTRLEADTGAKIGKMDAQERSEFFEKMAKARERTIEAESGLTRYERSVQAWHYLTSTIMITVSMWFFIAACSGYFPGLLQTGAVDVVLARPITRLTVFLGKYIGGLALFAVALIAFDVILFVGVGARTGVWHARLFLSVPLHLFMAALLYAILAFLGILTRGPALPIILGYLFYMFIDTALAALIQFQTMGMLEDIAWLDKTATILRAAIPNFSMLKDYGNYAVLELPNMDWRPFLTGGVWLVVSLALGFWIFRRRDY